MRDEITILGNLVTSLDDVRLFCTNAGDHIERPWLEHVFAQLAQTHRLIADELCTHVKTMGGERVQRNDHRRQGWRTAWSEWLVRSHFDSDLAYLQQAERREDRLTRRFARAIRRTPDGDTHWRLEHHVYEIDCARMKITRVLALLQDDIDARRIEAHVGARSPATVASRRTATRANRDLHA